MKHLKNRLEVSTECEYQPVLRGVIIRNEHKTLRRVHETLRHDVCKTRLFAHCCAFFPYTDITNTRCVTRYVTPRNASQNSGQY